MATKVKIKGIWCTLEDMCEADKLKFEKEIQAQTKKPEIHEPKKYKKNEE